MFVQAGFGLRSKTIAITTPTSSRSDRQRRLDRLALEKFFERLNHEAEHSSQVALNGHRVRAQLRACSSGKAFTLPRRDALLDRDIFKEVQCHMRAGVAVRLTPATHPAVLSVESPFNTDTMKREKQLTRQANKHNGTAPLIHDLHVPGWDHIGPKLKTLSWAMVLKDMDAVDFSVRLAPSIIAMARRHDRGVAAFLRDRIQRELRAQFDRVGLPPPVLFVSVEHPLHGEAHIHGVVGLPGRKSPLIEGDGPLQDLVKATKVTMDNISGDWVGPSGRDAGRKVDVGCLETPLRWLSYCTKFMYWSERMIGGPAIAASNELRSMGRAWYVHARRTGVVILPGPNWLNYGSIDLDDLLGQL